MTASFTGLTRLPKIALYSELEHGTRSHGGQICWRRTWEP